MFHKLRMGMDQIKRNSKCCSSKLLLFAVLVFYVVFFIALIANYGYVHPIQYFQGLRLSSPVDPDSLHVQSHRGNPNNGERFNKKAFHKQYASSNSETLESLDKRYLLHLIKQTFSNTSHPDIPDYKFDETLSHSIPLDRETPDYRNKDCHAYPWVISPDKRVSIIIPFINEPWSVLLRTVFSVLTKSPLQYIQEIILVDDNSTRDYLLEPLNRVLHPFRQISLVRTPRGIGPAGTRNYGARFAKGNTLVFLDAHVEMNVGWLEPLLDANTKYPEKIFNPIIGTIASENMKILKTRQNSQNVLTWTLGATRGPFQRSVLEKHSVTEPIPSASMFGAAFIMDKSYFWKLGGMGEYFIGWGGEDVEIGIKSWLCGGGIGTCRCSIVSHLFKDHPYKMNTKPWRNVAMMAEAWLDEFLPVSKCIRFGYLPLTHIVDKAPLESTFALKKRLECKPFRWFIDHVYPGLGIPEAGTRFIGASVSGGYRISLGKDNVTMVFSQIYSPVVSPGPVAVVDDTVKLLGKCMTYTDTNTFVFDTCRSGDRFQKWQYVNFQIRAKFHTRLCLGRQNYRPVLQNCSKSKLKITFQTRFKAGCLRNIKYPRGQLKQNEFLF